MQQHSRKIRVIPSTTKERSVETPHKTEQSSYIFYYVLKLCMSLCFKH
jgi:hypothetical protein